MAAAAAAACTFPFLKLPRELRDAIYNLTFSIPDSRGDRALRIERRHLRHFTPSPCSILLTLHHEHFLLNQQVAREALEALFKNHTVFLSCGPYVLQRLLARIEEQGGYCRQALAWLRQIELDWVTFPNLRVYPPERTGGRHVWWWESDGQQDHAEHVSGAAYNRHYDEHDYEGSHYDDNFYGAQDHGLYPTWKLPAGPATSQADDAFGLAHHYPFFDLREDHNAVLQDTESRLALLVSAEVIPLFDYLATPVFSLTSITLPLYFISRTSHIDRSAIRPGYTLPVKVRYWSQVCIHALLLLNRSTPPSSPAAAPAPTLREVRIKYMPWDIWASMDPADNLHRMVERGVWYRDSDDPHGERQCEGEAFRAIWAGLQELGLCQGDDRMGLGAGIRFVEWEGDLDKYRVGDELSVVFTKGADPDQELDVEMENPST